jgi:hypothetical protein
MVKNIGKMAILGKNAKVRQSRLACWQWRPRHRELVATGAVPVESSSHEQSGEARSQNP